MLDILARADRAGGSTNTAPISAALNYQPETTQ